MITFKDYNLEIIRYFSQEEFLSHIKLIEDILSENDFGDNGIANLLDQYLIMIHNYRQQFQEKGITEFKLSKNEVFLYDIIIETARLCYKHSCPTASDTNDWEEEFE